MPLTVVVTFYSRGGTTEDLAHAAAVGAVQQRALIRLRRVADIGAQPGAEVARMQKEYIALRDVDVAAADGLIFASPADVDASSPEWRPVFELLERMHSEGRLSGKVAGVVGHGASGSLAAAVSQVGLPVVDAREPAAQDETARAVALGREVAAAARAAGSNA